MASDGSVGLFPGEPITVCNNEDVDALVSKLRRSPGIMQEKLFYACRFDIFYS